MKYYIHTLGCKVNTYESKVMSDILSNNGYSKGSIDDSEIIVINTCFVTNVAEKKSLQMIRKLSKQGKLVIVTGCLSQAKPEDVAKIKEVSIILGNQDKSKLIDYINDYKQEQVIKIYNLNDLPFEEMKLNNFDKTRAFVKIQDGCENFCSYCIIPFTRGKLRNKKKEDVINEVTTLVKTGHKEIVLTGIHTGNYKDEDYKFSDLLNDLVKIENLINLRISSIEITEVTNEVLNVIKNNKILVDHMHIPLQSGNDEVLKGMNRKYDIAYFMNKVDELRKIRPNISLTTDVIVGFPGESEEMFENTIKNIKEINFSKLHVFPFSKREGTKAASMINQIPEDIKKQRVKKLLEISKQLEISYMTNQLNKTLSFLPETYIDGVLTGHTGNYLSVKVEGEENLLNTSLLVKITSIDYPYCFGKKL